jgi:hypothetical protein
VLTAGASRFLNLSQSGYRPDRYREPSRFEPGGPSFSGAQLGCASIRAKLAAADDQPALFTQKITVSSIRAVAVIA